MTIASNDVIVERGAVIKYWKSLHFGHHCTIQANAYVYGSRQWERHVVRGLCHVISHGCTLLGEGGLSVGDYTHLGPGVAVTTQYGDSRSDPCVPPNPKIQVRLGEDRPGVCWIGISTALMPGGAAWGPMRRGAELGCLRTMARLHPAGRQPGQTIGARAKLLTTVVISQPMYFPWPGFFELVACADVYVHLADAQFSKGSFTNRVQIKKPGGFTWMTVPLAGKGSFQVIEALQPADPSYYDRHRKLLLQLLRGAPYLDMALDLFDAATARATLVEVLMASIEEGTRRLDLQRPDRWIQRRATCVFLGGRRRVS